MNTWKIIKSSIIVVFVASNTFYFLQDLKDKLIKI